MRFDVEPTPAPNWGEPRVAIEDPSQASKAALDFLARLNPRKMIYVFLPRYLALAAADERNDGLEVFL